VFFIALSALELHSAEEVPGLKDFNQIRRTPRWWVRVRVIPEGSSE
jgi:hypothetical protein